MKSLRKQTLASLVLFFFIFPINPNSVSLAVEEIGLSQSPVKTLSLENSHPIETEPPLPPEELFREDEAIYPASLGQIFQLTPFNEIQSDIESFKAALNNVNTREDQNRDNKYGWNDFDLLNSEEQKLNTHTETLQALNAKLVPYIDPNGVIPVQAGELMTETYKLSIRISGFRGELQTARRALIAKIVEPIPPQENSEAGNYLGALPLGKRTDSIPVSDRIETRVRFYDASGNLIGSKQVRQDTGRVNWYNPQNVLIAHIPGEATVRVTNLAAEGPGSLTAALKMTGKRKIVFDVGGVIDLRSTSADRPIYYIEINSGDVTIDGSTAPSPGVTLYGAGFLIRASNVTIKHMIVRPGADAVGPGIVSRDAIKIHADRGPIDNLLFENNTFTWSTDELVEIFFGDLHPITNITFRNNIFANALETTRSHSHAALVGPGSSHIIFEGNLIANNRKRNPKFTNSANGLVVNNVISNPLGQAISIEGSGTEPTKLALVGNIVLPGPSTKSFATIMNLDGGTAVDGAEVYMHDNYFENAHEDGLNCNPAVDLPCTFNNPQCYDWGVSSKGDGEIICRATDGGPGRTDPAVSAPPMQWMTDYLSEMNVLDVENVEASVLSKAGARPWNRDIIDQAIINSVIHRNGKVLTYPPSSEVQYILNLIAGNSPAITSSSFARSEDSPAGESSPLVFLMESEQSSNLSEGLTENESDGLVLGSNNSKMTVESPVERYSSNEMPAPVVNPQEEASRENLVSEEGGRELPNYFLLPPILRLDPIYKSRLSFEEGAARMLPRMRKKHRLSKESGRYSKYQSLYLLWKDRRSRFDKVL